MGWGSCREAPLGPAFHSDVLSLVFMFLLHPFIPLHAFTASVLPCARLLLTETATKIVIQSYQKLGCDPLDLMITKLFSEYRDAS